MSEELALEPKGKPYLDYLPVGMFGSVMGLTGLSVGWHMAEEWLGLPPWISSSTAVAAVAVFVALSLAYAVKACTAWPAVQREFDHPIAGNLFGTILVSLLLLPIVIAPHMPVLAIALWSIGAVGMFAFAWLIISRWMSDRQQIAHATPAWVIPVVGLLDVPLALPSLESTGLHLPPMHGLMMSALAIGLFFAVPLFTLIFSRLLFEPPMPDALKPTLMILVAPFAVGSSAYTVVRDGPDLFSDSLYMLSLFLVTILVGQLRFLPVCCPFRMSWWAVSFPLAAFAIASLRFAGTHPGMIATVVAAMSLGFATIIIASLFFRSVVGVLRGELRTLSA